MKLKIIFLSIIILAAILRLTSLVSYPAGLNADEAALGYNAYSLLLTGKDEHGHPWPTNLESFGDYKPALYSYILIPFVKVLGLTELAVRLPSALFGILAVAFIYLLAQEIFSQTRISLISAFLLAISPWAIHFSRGAWEVNVATTMIIIGAWSFLRWVKQSRPWYLIITVICLVLSMYTYQSARIIAPLLGLSLALIYLKTLVSRPLHVLTSGVVLVLVSLPLIFSLFNSNTASRLSGVGILADQGPINRINELRGHFSQPNSLIPRVFHNKLVIYSIQFIKNYTDHFNPDFLFINGDTVERSRVPETGQLYLTDVVILCFGLIFLLRHSSGKSTKFIWSWLLIAPIASALTFQTPSALRSQNMIIPLTLISAAGLYYLFKLASASRVIVYSLLLVTLVAYSWQFSGYLHEYYVHYPQTYPAAWEYGFSQLVPYVTSVQDKYSEIYVTDKYDQPYILFLFYSLYPPQEFQFHHELTFRDKFNFSTVRSFGKYRFTSTPWDKVRDIHSALIVAAPEDLPDVGVNIVKTIYFPNGQPAFKIVSN